VSLGDDGKLYQLSYTGTNASNYNAFVTVIDPADMTHAVVINAGPGIPEGFSPTRAPNGDLYLATGVSGGTQHVVIIDPANPTHPTVITIAGSGYATNMQVASDGTAYLGVYTWSGSGSSLRYALTMTAIDPDDLAHPQSATFTGLTTQPYNIEGAPNGVVYQSVYGSGGTGQPVNVFDMKTGAQTTVTIPGEEFFTPSYGPDGTRYQTSRTRSNVTHYLTVVDPDDPANFITFENSYYSPDVTVGPEGAGYQPVGPYDSTMRVFLPDDPYHPTTIGLGGAALGPIIFKDGQAYVVAGSSINVIDLASSLPSAL
jgi:hypothetical protein